ncbi:MAG: CRISPR-associated endonuclease Cas1 [Candidatus Schekmanbacteria bacterium]|nr:MAG: CRISPR-associated endonuclease Cas1 [Candidatus Schekmanbacteria bacterium]
MSILYLIEQGTILSKQSNKLVLKKGKNILLSVPSFKVDQVVLFGNIAITPQAIAFLLKNGIDTVFLTGTGRYRGRLVPELGKNIELRIAQFNCLQDREFALQLATRYVYGKLKNYRTFLRRQNQILKIDDIQSMIHKIRGIMDKIKHSSDFDYLRGLEGIGSKYYFQVFGNLIKQEGIVFEGRNRRPPRDPVNAMLSFGYTLLANTIEGIINCVGLDPYLGSLHSVEYGRPSLTLDIMEEFRPVLIDSLVLKLLNKKIITLKNFYVRRDMDEIYEDNKDESENLTKEDYPVLMTYEGIKKFLIYYEKQMNNKVFYPRLGSRMTYKDICLAQARLLANSFMEKDILYEPFLIR